MNKAIIRPRVLEVLRRTFQDDGLVISAAALSDDDYLRADLGAGDLELDNLREALETAFDIDIPRLLARRLATVGDVVRYIEERLS